MKAYSWYERFREEYFDEQDRDSRIAALPEAPPLKNGKPIENYNEVEDRMHHYAYLGMEEELFTLGEELASRFEAKEDQWRLAEYVYPYYAIFYMMQRRPHEAEPWYMETLASGALSPSSLWPDIAACYIEMGAFDQADFYIEKLIAKDKEENRNMFEWVDYAKYYLSTERPQRALEILLEEEQASDLHALNFLLTIGRVYTALKDYESATNYFQKQLARFGDDYETYGHLGSAVYSVNRNLEIAEKYYLKSLELAPSESFALDWKISIYENLCLCCANECLWEKSYHYLLGKYLLKYSGEQAEPFKQTFAAVPPIENDEMGQDFLHMLFNMESNLILPHQRNQPDSILGESTLGETVDLDKLLNLESGQLN